MPCPRSRERACAPGEEGNPLAPAFPPAGPALIRARACTGSLLASSPGRRCLRVTQEEALVVRPSALIQPDSGPGKTQGDSAVTNRLLATDDAHSDRLPSRRKCGHRAGGAGKAAGLHPAAEAAGWGVCARGRYAGSGGQRARGPGPELEGGREPPRTRS